MLKSLFVVASVVFSAPVGESGRFLLNHTLSSNIMLEGRADVDVVAANDIDATVELDCAFKVRFIGDLGGAAAEHLPLTLFNGELLDQLKRDGSIVDEDFTAHYEGVELITLQNGTSHTVDKIMIDGINTAGTEDHPCFQRLVTAMAKVYDRKAAVSNLVIKGYVAPGQILGGLVRIVVSGRSSGVNFIAGLDKE